MDRILGPSSGRVGDLKHTKLPIYVLSSGLIIWKGDIICSTRRKKDLGYYSSFDDVRRLTEKAKKNLEFGLAHEFLIIINREEM